jgi:hypothetical protein
MDAPSRAPLACGALGDYSHERVLAMSAALGGGPRPVHEDPGSILLLDREPLRWGSGHRLGLGWTCGSLWREGATEWQQASRGGACGLAIDGRRRYLHSSVSGLGPLYWIDQGGATYFATRIDPLVETSPVPLSVDWDAWAAIIALRYALGERTPFAEVRRLGPHSTLRRRLGRNRVRAHRWPWAEIDPRLSHEEGAEAIAAALGEMVAELDGELACPLSGGLDSRLLLSTVVSLGRASPLALTVSDDEGARFEQEPAEMIAQALEVPWEEVGAAVADYPADWEERARRVEHQFVDHAWLVPLARRIESVQGPALDGFALDSLLQTGARFHSPEVIDPPNPRAGTRALFDRLRLYGLTHEALEPRFREPLVERARAQFEAAARPFEGHPSQPVLSLYATRTVRGVSTYPSGLLGTGAQVLAPGIDDRVATAMLSVPSAVKREGSMHAAIQALIASRLLRVPSTGDTERTPPALPRRWRSEPALAMHRGRLEDGPLAPHVAPELLTWLRDPGRGELSPHLRLGMEALSLFHSWCDRHRAQLRAVDPADLIG